MASPTPRRPPQPRHPVHETVDPVWLLKALGLAIGAASVLAYISVCLLLYQGGWQRMLFPSPKVDRTPATPFSAVRFDAASTGNPRLSGWWIPGSSQSAPTILFLHDARGSLSDAVPTLELLHQAGPNVFAFDFRGFGRSDGPHPTESRMAEDSTAALTYLLTTRHIPAAQIVPYGQGLAASLAAQLADLHPELPALIIEDPDLAARDTLLHGREVRFLPMNLLLQEHFDLRAPLLQSKNPELLFTSGPYGSNPRRVQANLALFASVPAPKFIVTLQGNSGPADYTAAVKRFLDEYLPQSTDRPKALP